MPVAFMTGRFIFGGFFIMSGLHHLLSSQTMARFAAAKGVPAPEVAVVLTGLLILFGGVSILLGWRAELGLGAIAIFLIGVTPLMHNFWVEAGAERAADMGNLLIISAVPRPWPYSVEERHLIRG